MAADIRTVSPGTEAAESTAGELRASVEAFAQDHGAALAGFALVTWDLNGAVKTALSAQRGVVGVGMVPALAHSALTVHRSVQCAAPEKLEPVGA